MRILHVTQGYSPAIGGTELLIQRISEEMSRAGDDVTVFTTDCYNAEAFNTPALPRLPSGWDDVNGIKVRRFPVRRRFSRALRGPQAVAYRLRLPFNARLRELSGGPIVPGLRRAIREWPCDVVAASSFPLLHMFDALEGAHRAGRPCALHGGLHPHDAWGFQRPSIYEAVRRADAYIANTAYERDYVVGRGAAPERVHVIGVGVDPGIYEGVTADEAKWRLGFDTRPLVGFVGQLARHKGLDSLLRTMPEVWRVRPDVNLLIAGGYTLFQPEVERTIAAWPTAFRRRTRLFTNFTTEQKPWMFGAVDVFAYPSGYESFGIAYLEAWAAGKPVIGTTAGAIPTVIQAGTDGLLVEYQDDTALAAAILTLLDDPGRARRMGAAGRDNVHARYTWDRVAAGFRRVYASLV